jgi:hypothetical protein
LQLPTVANRKSILLDYIEKNCFYNICNFLYSGEESNIGGCLYNLQYANANDFDMLVYSYEGANIAYQYAELYPNILTCMPAGSNSFEYVFTRDVASCCMVTTGRGEEHNGTGYALEFF